MTPEQVVRFFGTRRAAAEACDVHYQTIYDWIVAGKIPKMRQFFIQTITHGQLKADELPGIICPKCGEVVKRVTQTKQQQNRHTKEKSP